MDRIYEIVFFGLNWVYFGQDFRMAGFFTLDTTGCFLDRIAGLQDFRDCYNSHPVHPVDPVHPVYFFARFLGK